MKTVSCTSATAAKTRSAANYHSMGNVEEVERVNIEHSSHKIVLFALMGAETDNSPVFQMFVLIPTFPIQWGPF